jgi:hypothetical protein
MLPHRRVSRVDELGRRLVHLVLVISPVSRHLCYTPIDSLISSLVHTNMLQVRRGGLSRGKDDEEPKMVMEDFYRRISMMINMK